MKNEEKQKWIRRRLINNYKFSLSFYIHTHTHTHTHTHIFSFPLSFCKRHKII